MGCFTKFFLFVLNFIVFALGVSVITLASLILHHGSQFKDLLDEGTLTVPIVLLVFGVVITFIGFFGCFGALRESPCLLYSYASIVLVLLIAQVGVAIYASLQKEEFKGLVSAHMVEIFNKYGGKDQELTNGLDSAQHELECCGVQSYADWINGTSLSQAVLPRGAVPKGCCKDEEDFPTCTVVQGKPAKDVEDMIYTVGCMKKYVDIVENESTWMIVGAIVLALVQLGCVVIACGIGRNAREQSY